MGFKTKVSGFYKIEVKKIVDGKEVITRTVDWFPNLITNTGLDLLATSNFYLGYCCVGSDNTTPEVTDSALGGLITADATVISREWGTESASPYYCWTRWTYRFGEGVAAGNLSEVGVSDLETSTALLSRALVLDTGGNPTTITMLSDEFLDVTYEIRFYPKLTDSAGSVVFTGSIGGSYSWDMRSSQVGVFGSNDSSDGWGWNQGVNTILRTMRGSGDGWKAYSSVMGPITGKPATLVTGNPVAGVTSPAYVPGSYEAYGVIRFELDEGNDLLGIRSLQGVFGLGTLQIEFDTPVMKTANDIFELTIKHSWARL
jgi:hypothetical protein